MQGNEDFFGTNRTPDLKLTVINDTQIDVVSLAKILGVNKTPAYIRALFKSRQTFWCFDLNQSY